MFQFVRLRLLKPANEKLDAKFHETDAFALVFDSYFTNRCKDNTQNRSVCFVANDSVNCGRERFLFVLSINPQLVLVGVPPSHIHQPSEKGKVLLTKPLT
jgi:hypothetical protein